MPEHRAPVWVTLHVLRGARRVRTSDTQHDLAEGQMLVLAPTVPHDVVADEEADMLLGVCAEVPANSAAEAR
jgi:quercetin dioxygenase-like cupin family protein